MAAACDEVQWRVALGVAIVQIHLLPKEPPQ
jgi:hypothetical protein